MKNDIIEKIQNLLADIQAEKENTQTSQAKVLVKTKALADIIKGCFDESKDNYVEKYGVGSIELENAKLTITESERNTTDYKAIATKYVDNLADIVPDYTTTTKTTTCRITAKLV